MSGKSGLWESIVHEAQQRVIEYLCSSTHSFEVESPLAQCMLRLIDTRVMSDIVHERNGNGYCGRIGCSNKLSNTTTCEQTRLQMTSRSSEELSSPSSPSSSCSEIEELEEEEEEEKKRKKANANSNIQKLDKSNKHVRESTLENDENEIVYDDDWFTCESFKLAALQQRQLNKLRRRQQQLHAKQKERKHYHKEQQEESSKEDHYSHAIHKAKRCHIARHCFCSLECLIFFKDVLIAKYVPHHVDYNHPGLTSIIANLFPNMQLETLKQLSTMECESIPGNNPNTPAPRTVLSTHIEEKNTTTNNLQTLKPIVVGVAYEDPTTLQQEVKDKEKESNHTKKKQERLENDAMLQQSLKQVWSAMDVVQKIWDNETRKEHHGYIENVTNQQQELEKETKGKNIVKKDIDDHKGSVKEKDNTKEGSEKQNRSNLDTQLKKEEEKEVNGCSISSVSQVNKPVKLLHGSLLIMDFVTNVTSELINALAMYSFVCRKQQIMQTVERFSNICNTSSSLQVMKEIINTVVLELNKKSESLCPNANNDNMTAEEEVKQYLCRAWHKHYDDHVHVNPIAQRQRREIFCNKSFMSISNSKSLSRLLRIDYDTLARLAWSLVWNTPMQIDNCYTDQHHDSRSNTDSTTKNSRKEEIHKLSVCTMMESLHFPFAIPSAFLLPLTQSPEALGLALVWVIASSVLHPCLLQELLFTSTSNVNNNNDDVHKNQSKEMPVVQLMSVIHMTKEEMISAVRTLIIDCNS